MNHIKHGDITTQKVVNGHWIAKTETKEPLKATITVKGNSEYNAYYKLMHLLKSTNTPTTIAVAPDGDKYYSF